MTKQPWIVREGVDNKQQWCELCERQVLEVDQSRVRGDDHLIMVCSDCRKEFPDRERCWWGKEQFKYYWDLGPIPIPHSSTSKTQRQWYEVELTKQQMLWMRAAGYQLLPAKEKAK